MFAGVTTLFLEPGKKGEASSIWNEWFVPRLQNQRGFHRAMLLLAGNTDKALGVDIWDDELAMGGLETSGLYQELLDQLGPVLHRPPSRQEYHLKISDSPAPAAPGDQPAPQAAPAQAASTSPLKLRV
ncbi:MAG: hypothetical protein ACREI3_10575 [Nitrospirales bacterium]